MFTAPENSSDFGHFVFHPRTFYFSLLSLPVLGITYLIRYSINRQHRQCIAESHTADPRNTANASATSENTRAMQRSAKRRPTRPPHQGGLCAPWTQVEFHWHASQRADRAGPQGPIRRSASLVLRLVHREPSDSRRSRCWSCSAGSLEARPEQAMRAISARGGQCVFQRERLTLPLMG